MAIRIWTMAALACLLTACAGMGTEQGAVTVEQVTLQQGAFRDAACTEGALPDSRIDLCLCSAKLNAAQTGNPAWDAALRAPVEELRCTGEAVADTREWHGNEHITTFTVTRNDGRWLSVVYDLYTMPAGAAHGMTQSRALLLDHNTGNWVEQQDIIAPHKHATAAGEVMRRLDGLNTSQYDGMLWLHEVDAARMFTAEGCSGCVVFPMADGQWTVRFSPYMVGPYAVGLVDVTLPEHFIR